MHNPTPKWLIYSLNFTLVLALAVVMLGAYTRLTHAGLGCPDWPFCYGKVLVAKPETVSWPVEKLAQSYSNVSFSSAKAWTEMSHRYLAGTLALLVFFITSNLIWQRKQVLLSLSLMALLVFQAALGMWTVTLKLLPMVVMGHLLGGILSFSLLCCLRLQLSTVRRAAASQVSIWISLGFLLLFCQIALGGWVSANYAGIACVGFPTCNGLWLPEWQFKEGFHLFSAVGTNYQGGVLDSASRVTIQMSHRIGALVVGIYLLGLAACLIKRAGTGEWPLVHKLLAYTLLVLVLVQWGLGILNVVYLLPLAIAVAHNGVAALLMATVCLLFVLNKKQVAYGR